MNEKVITDIIKEPSYEELQEVLEKWLDPGSDSSSSSTSKGSTPAKSASTVSKVDDIQSAFDELFDK